MWAGGSLAFSRAPGNRLSYFDEARLQERVESVQVRGEKLFVWFERRMFRAPVGAGEPALTERRCLVFLPPVGEGPPAQQQQRMLEVKGDVKRDFVETFTPTQHLLFRFSALTHNVHRIHYDEGFSRTEEGYRGNLCHGPLAVVFLLGLLKREMPRGKRIVAFEYKCLAPMFVGEPYRIAGRWKGEEGDATRKCELWVETPQGGYAVRGTAEVENDVE
ncbi:mitochondrial 3-hydroxyacyl-thioester dehydratase [Tricharina praecox]|uniref:mitochondrial 3-hydroxyacyl-thioester dehydratase n=1 Tax=Tricharina praecox TaxID=43433 RepID=UPI002220D2F5|nr:mitochondrial 3-hydroxyacyl-thioester dehydratase [Tricharina praecox]KAI5854938.1 mitochondrial 3-hydroxyacyl-thioester dehydratase [Tricharina praecox]